MMVGRAVEWRAQNIWSNHNGEKNLKQKEQHLPKFFSVFQHWKCYKLYWEH